MKKLKLSGLVLLGLMVILLCASGITAYVVGNRFDAEITAIKANREPLSPMDLSGTPVPDADNGALVYEQAFALMDSGAYNQPLKALAKLTFDDPELVCGASQALREVNPILDLIEQAAYRPQCRFQRDWPKRLHPLWVESFPETARLRRISRLLNSATGLCARNGQMGQAANYAELGFLHAGSLKGEPSMQLLAEREMMLQMSSEALRDMLQCARIDEQRARSLFDLLASIDLDSEFVTALQGARVFWLRDVNDWSGSEFVSWRFLENQSNTQAAQVAGGLSGFAYDHVFAQGDAAICLRFFADQIEGAKLSYGDLRSVGLLEENTHLPFYAIKARLFTIPGSSELQFLRITSKTRISLDMALLALQAYKARYGGYPASMRELKSKLGWKLPKDPFSEKDFIYKRQAKGFILYSVGPDMRDDGGRSLGDHVELDSKGDIVLRWDR